MADSNTIIESAIILVGERKYVVDADLYTIFSDNQWYTNNRGYAVCRAGLMHRLVMGAVSGQIVDHISGDIRDNRRVNLRICTHAENMRNRRSVSGSSLYKGVKIELRPSGSSRIRATITHNRKTIHLGTFKTEEDAARAYDAMAIRLQGSFACTNEDLGLIPRSCTAAA